jgi:hypothetical protein
MSAESMYVFGCFPDIPRVLYTTSSSSNQDELSLTLVSRQVQNFAVFYWGDQDQTKVEGVFQLNPPCHFKPLIPIKIFGNNADKEKVLKLFGNIHPTLLKASELVFPNSLN